MYLMSAIGTKRTYHSFLNDVWFGLVSSRVIFPYCLLCESGLQQSNTGHHAFFVDLPCLRLISCRTLFHFPCSTPSHLRQARSSLMSAALSGSSG